MSLRQKQECDLRSLLSKIEAAREPTDNLVADILMRACPRLRACPSPNEHVRRLVKAQAWVDLGFWLIGWELPDWSIHRLSCDDRRWNCAICIRGLAINWIEDITEFQHDSPVLAILGALVQAQIVKTQGHAPSNVTIFRTITRAGPEHASAESEGQ